MMRVRFATATAVMVCVLVVGVAPAGAAIKLAFTGVEFGGGVLERPNAVAVDQSSGNVYVTDQSAKVVDVFGPEGGSPVGGGPSQLTGASAPEPFNFGAPGEPAGIAIDNSGGPSDGAIYVVVLQPHGVVDKFHLNAAHEYEYLCQLTGPANGGGCHRNEPSVEVEGELNEPTGVAVDAHGNVYVSDFGNRVIDEFDSEGKDLANAQGGQIKVSEHPILAGSNSTVARPASLAISPAGTLYAVSYEPENGVVGMRLNAIGEFQPGSETFVAKFPHALAVDPSSEQLYVDQRTELRQFSAADTLLEGIGLPGLTSEGVASYGATHAVYVSSVSEHDVREYGPVTLPNVHTGAAIEVTDTAVTLTGEANPLATSEASDYFEYGETRSYGATAPEPPGDPLGGGGSPVPVSPRRIEGLTPGTTYHYRLDATNASHVVEEGEDGAFTTLPELPKVDEPPAFASDVSAEAATLHGTVQPGNGATTYHFVYGTTEAYGHTLPSIGIGSGFSPVEVEQATAPELQPATTYHFALIAENAAGTTIGPDHEFTTPATAPPPTRVPVVGAVTVIDVNQTEATLSGVVDPEGVPTTYAFELGYAPGAYETRVYGSLAGELGARDETVTFSSLQPGTVYHFRVVATSAAGTTASPDQTFATALFAQSIAIPPAPLLIPFTAPKESSPGTTTKKSKRPTRAQKLAKALRACARKSKSTRAACEHQARRKFANTNAKGRKKHGHG